MKEAEIPLDFSFVFDLAEPPSLEDIDFIEARLWPNRTLKLQ